MDKKAIYLGATLGGAIGGYVPVLFGADGFSFWAVLTSTIGGIAGIILVNKMTS